MTKEPSIQEKIENSKLKDGQACIGETSKNICVFTEQELHSLLEAYAKEQREICADKLRIHDYKNIYEYENREKEVRNAPSPLTEKQ